MTEARFQSRVIELAALYQWLHHRTHDSRCWVAGWPDPVLARPPDLIVAEPNTDGGRVNPEQKRWLNALVRCGIETHVWRLSQFDAIHTRLARRSA